MDAEQYFKLINTLDILSKEMKKDLNSKDHNAIDPNRMDKEDLLYGLFEIVPQKRFLSNNGYHKSKDKDAYNEQCVEKIWNQIVRPYQLYVGAKLSEQLKMIANGLCNGLFTVGSTQLFVPNSMVDYLEKKYRNHGDGKEIVIEILNYWRQEIVTNEWKQEFEGYKRVETPVKVSQETYTARIASVYGESTYNSEVEDYNPYDVDDVDDYSSTGDSRFDEDGSNWSYNEEHD